MARLTFSEGAYQAKSIIASAQRCVNLYCEINPKDSPSPMTLYPRPGLRTLVSPPVSAKARGLYRATNGSLFSVCGNAVYGVNTDWSMTLLGTIASGKTTPVSMSDNGIDMMIVDGSTNGYVVNLASRAFSNIASTAFYGADSVQFMDTYFILNRPGLPTIYISLSNSTSFDPLDFASKTGKADAIQSIQVIHREVWVIGSTATEVWTDTGAADFAFGPINGVYIEHGTCAKYSCAKEDVSIYWLSQDDQGRLMVLQGKGYEAKRISTHAIENEIQSYATVDDAVGMTYQIEGHTFYHLSFPTADKTWVYDISNEQWHEQSWIDTNGQSHMHRGAFCAFAYGVNVMADWENGTIYAVDVNVFTDAGNPILFLRSFPHIESSGKRLIHSQFIADMEVGRIVGLSSNDPDPVVSLRWSNDRGASWGSPVTQSIGSTGEYLTSMQFQRLGMARDRIYELYWSVPAKTALNGAFVDVVGAKT